MAINQAVISGKIAMQLSDETMEQVATIQQLRERSNQPISLNHILEDSIRIYYNQLISARRIAKQL